MAQAVGCYRKHQTALFRRVEKWRKATISFVIFFCPSVHMEQLDSHWTNFDEIWYLVFSKICQKKSSFIKIRQEQRVLYMKTFSHIWQYFAKFFLEWQMFRTKVVEKIKTHISFAITFFRKSCRLWDNNEKCGGARGHKWRRSMAHTRCMLDKQDYTHARTCTRPLSRASTHALTHLRARAHIHTQTNIILIAFSWQQWFAKGPHCYAIRTLPVLFAHFHVRLYP